MNIQRVFFLAALMAAIQSGAARADLIGLDMLVQSNAAGNQLITGWYNDGDDTRGQPQRVYGGTLTSSFDTDEPGVRAVTSSIPAGMLALPASQDVHLDLLPMTIGSTTSNLFYWNGSGAVSFSNVTAGYTLEISGTGGFSVTADGTNSTQTDTDPFVVTGAGGFIHKHPDYVLDNGGTPAEGVYLISLGFRMPSTTLGDAQPVFVVLGTSTIGDPAVESAAQWVNDNLANASVPEPSALVLTGLAVGGLWFRRRRHAARSATEAASGSPA